MSTGAPCKQFYRRVFAQFVGVVVQFNHSNEKRPTRQVQSGYDLLFDMSRLIEKINMNCYTNIRTEIGSVNGTQRGY